MIIQNGFATPYKDNFYLFGFLINTWRLFEDFLYQFFKKYLPTNIVCSFQESFKRVRTDLLERPDFVLKTDDWWAICDAKYKGNLTKYDYNQMHVYCSNIQNKIYVNSSEIPEIVRYVFLYPYTKDRKYKDFSIEHRGIYKVIHAPIRLSKEYVRNDEYLKGFIDQLLKIITK